MTYLPGPHPNAMFDAIEPSAVPANALLVAGYVDGHWPSGGPGGFRLTHPHAYCVTITVIGHPGARVADIESGDLTPDSGARWAFDELHAGRRPTLYCSLGSWDSCKAALRRHGAAPSAVDWWIAHFTTIGRVPTERPEPPQGAVALQFAADVPHNGHAYDESITNGWWPYWKPAPVLITP